MFAMDESLVVTPMPYMDLYFKLRAKGEELWKKKQPYQGDTLSDKAWKGTVGNAIAALLTAFPEGHNVSQLYLSRKVDMKEKHGAK